MIFHWTLSALFTTLLLTFFIHKRIFLMSIKKIKQIAVTIIALGMASTTYAVGPGFYTGIQMGMTNTHNARKSLPAPTGPLVSPSTTGVGARFFIGDDITRYFGIELGLTRYGTANYKADTGDTGSTHTNAFDFEGKGMFPFTTSGVSLFGKLGFTYLRASDSGKLVARGDSSVNSGLRALVGVGISYDLSQNWVVDLSGTRAISKSSTLPSANFAALGIAYHITDKYCGQFLC
jgi:hypothetical protein